jgi:hypothetical protein
MEQNMKPRAIFEKAMEGGLRNFTFELTDGTTLEGKLIGWESRADENKGFEVGYAFSLPDGQYRHVQLSEIASKPLYKLNYK